MKDAEYRALQSYGIELANWGALLSDLPRSYQGYLDVARCASDVWTVKVLQQC